MLQTLCATLILLTVIVETTVLGQLSRQAESQGARQTPATVVAEANSPYRY